MRRDTNPTDTNPTDTNPTDTNRPAPLRRPSLARLLASGLLAATLLTACGGATDAAPPPTTGEDQPIADDDTDVASEDEVGDAPHDAHPPAEPEVHRAVRVSDHLDVLAAPAPDSPLVETLEPTTTFGSVTVAAIVDERDGWLELELAGRPTGRTGWVRADEPGIEVVDTTMEVRVDLDALELTVIDGDEVLLTTPVAIGDADHPTPTGRAFLTDKLDTQDPDGPYGPFALGLSVRSELLTEFAGGDGQIGIHGTNDPSSIGRAVSHGCVRVPNDVVRQLAEMLPLGTPVVVS